MEDQMTTREWLSRGRVLGNEIESMLKASPVCRMEDVSADIMKKFDKWILVKIELLNAIMKLSDSRDKTILLNYYCNRMTVAEVAEDLGLSWLQTHRLLKAAVNKLGEVLNL